MDLILFLVDTPGRPRIPYYLDRVDRYSIVSTNRPKPHQEGDRARPAVAEATPTTERENPYVEPSTPRAGSQGLHDKKPLPAGPLPYLRLALASCGHGNATEPGPSAGDGPEFLEPAGNIDTNCCRRFGKSFRRYPGDCFR